MYIYVYIYMYIIYIHIIMRMYTIVLYNVWAVLLQLCALIHLYWG